VGTINNTVRYPARVTRTAASRPTGPRTHVSAAYPEPHIACPSATGHLRGPGSAPDSPVSTGASSMCWPLCSGLSRKWHAAVGHGRGGTGHAPPTPPGPQGDRPGRRIDDRHCQLNFKDLSRLAQNAFGQVTSQPRDFFLAAWYVRSTEGDNSHARHCRRAQLRGLKAGGHALRNSGVHGNLCRR
jgi:hypothetical protein